MFCILLALSHNVLWTFPRITLCRPSLLFGWITLHSICVYHSLSVPSSEVAQSCLTLCDPMDCSLLRSSVYGIFQARVLECVAISFSRGSSWPRDRTQVSRTVGRRFTVWATREVPCSLLKIFDLFSDFWLWPQCCHKYLCTFLFTYIRVYLQGEFLEIQ